MDFEREALKTIPVWVQLRLHLKYQGEKSLHKIVSQLGDPIKHVEATRNREKLQYARVLIEIDIDQKLLDNISFQNEHGFLTEVPVIFEWKPTRGQNCKNFGHVEQDCRLKKTKKVWITKVQARGKAQNFPEPVVIASVSASKEPRVEPVHEEVDPHGF